MDPQPADLGTVARWPPAFKVSALARRAGKMIHKGAIDPGFFKDTSGLNQKGCSERKWAPAALSSGAEMTASSSMWLWCPPPPDTTSHTSSAALGQFRSRGDEMTVRLPSVPQEGAQQNIPTAPRGLGPGLGISCVGPREFHSFTWTKPNGELKTKRSLLQWLLLL